MFEEGAGVTAELQHVHVSVDDHAGRAVVVQQDALGLLLHVAQARTDRCGRPGFQPRGNGVHLGRALSETNAGTNLSSLFEVYLRPLVEQCEQVGESADAFGGAQHENGVWFERIVK